MELKDPYEIAEAICEDLKGRVNVNLREDIEGAIAEAIKEARITPAMLIAVDHAVVGSERTVEVKWTKKPDEEWKAVPFYPLGSDTPTSTHFACPDCGEAFIVPVEHDCRYFQRLKGLNLCNKATAF